MPNTNTGGDEIGVSDEPSQTFRVNLIDSITVPVAGDYYVGFCGQVLGGDKISIYRASGYALVTN